jgi:hypothetical protein
VGKYNERCVMFLFWKNDNLTKSEPIAGTTIQKKKFPSAKSPA